MCGTYLRKKLHWLVKSNQLMKLVNDDSDEFEHDEANEEHSESSSTELIGRGTHCGGNVRKRKKSRDVLDDERNIQRAMPEMDSTLSNWTLHGQNLGKMLRNYKRQYRDLFPDQCRELGHFSTLRRQCWTQ